MDILIIDVGRRLFQGTEKCGNNTEVSEQKTLKYVFKQNIFNV